MPVTKRNIKDLLEGIEEEKGARIELAPLSKVPPGLPETWVQVLTDKDPTKVVWDILWKPMAKDLPKTIRSFKKSLQGIGLLTSRAKPPSLLYIVTEDEGTDAYGYRGFAAGPVRHPKAKLLPAGFLKFYEVHNGWVFHATNSLGPLPVEDWYPLSADEKSPSGCFLSVFHDGGGAHVGFDLEEKPPKSYTVWPDDGPKPAPNIWKRIDDWIAAQNEDSDPA